VGDSSGGARADVTVEHDVIGVGRDADDAVEKALRLRGRERIDLREKSFDL
jgi:hypothetical protein